MNSLNTNTERRRSGVNGSWKEIAALVAASLGAIGLFSYLPHLLPFLFDYSSALIAATFIYLPALVLWRRRETLDSVGVKLSGRGAGVFLAVVAVVFSLFAMGFFAYHQVVFGRRVCPDAGRLLAWPDTLYLTHLERSSEALVVGKNDRDELLLLNRSAAALELDGDWEPADMRVHRGMPDSPDEVTRLGPVTPGGSLQLEPDEALIFSPPPGRVKVSLTRVEPRVEVWAGNRSEVELPYEAETGWKWVVTFLAMQLLLVALPEEIFYRGYLQTRLQGRLGVRYRVLGGDVGPALWLTSALFAIGHLVAIPAPGRLAVFFPSLLFGWLRDRTGSVTWPILLHALSNLLLALLTRLLC